MLHGGDIEAGGPGYREAQVATLIPKTTWRSGVVDVSEDQQVAFPRSASLLDYEELCGASFNEQRRRLGTTFQDLSCGMQRIDVRDRHLQPACRAANATLSATAVLPHRLSRKTQLRPSWSARSGRARRPSAATSGWLPKTLNTRSLNIVT
ncbi:MAG TPA: hypothetical protein VF495_24790 [Phenylobacterium sp.]